MKAVKYGQPVKRFRPKHVPKAMIRFNGVEPGWWEQIISESEFRWRQAAREAERRIIANHYCPTMPAKHYKGAPMAK